MDAEARDPERDRLTGRVARFARVGAGLHHVVDVVGSSVLVALAALIAHPPAMARWRVVVLGVLSIPLFSLRLGQLDAGTNPTSQSIRRAYDLIAQNFGPGVNGPLSVVVSLPKGNSTQQNQTLLQNTQGTLAKTPGVAAAGTPSPSPLPRAGTAGSIA